MKLVPVITRCHSLRLSSSQSLLPDVVLDTQMRKGNLDWREGNYTMLMRDRGGEKFRHSAVEVQRRMWLLILGRGEVTSSRGLSTSCM